MVFDKIEITYDKFTLPVKIKYSETRKPTFMEFLLLSIIIDHPYPQKSIKTILKDDFKIEKTELFEKSLQDLVSFKLVCLKQSIAGWTAIDLEITLDKLQVEPQLAERFFKKEYWISQSNKQFETKWVHDPLKNEQELVREIDWQRKIPGIKISTSIKLENLNSSFYDYENVFSKAKAFVAENKEQFAEKTQIQDILLTSGVEFRNSKVAQDLTNKVSKAVEVWIELNNLGDFKIKSKDKDLEVYLSTKKSLCQQIVSEVIKKYSEKIKLRFVPKPNLENENEYVRNPELITDIHAKPSANILLMNGQNISSLDEILKSKDLIENVKYIIIYNSKSNQKTVETRDDRIIVHTDSVRDELLQNNSLVYVDSDLVPNIYSFVSHVGELNLPVAFTSKNKEKLNLKNSFSESVNRLYTDLKTSLANQKFDHASTLIKVLKKIGEPEKLEQIIKMFIDDNINKLDLVKSFGEALVSNENRYAVKLFETCLKEVLLKIFKSKSDSDIINDLFVYRFTNKETLCELINKIESDYIRNEYDFILNLNKVLKKINLDVFELNLRDANLTLWRFAKNNLRIDLLNVQEFNSSQWQKQSKLINQIGAIIKFALQSNWREVKVLYPELIDTVFDFENLFSKQSDLIKLLPDLSECLNQFFEISQEQLIVDLETLDKESVKKLEQVKNEIQKLIELTSKVVVGEQQNWPLISKLIFINNQSTEKKVFNFDKIIQIKKLLKQQYQYIGGN